MSHIKVATPADTMQAIVSMNNIFTRKGVRLYQNSFDTDGKGSFLTVSIDPWGIAVSYLGYALLFISLIWMLITPQGTFRKLLSDKRLSSTVLLVLLSIGCGTPKLSAAPRVLPETTAEQFGRLHMLYNGRICQLQTYALDFTKKICGKRSYNGYSAEQVLTGFIFYHADWSHEPLVKVKSGAVRERLGLGKNVSVDDFFGNGDYILGPLLQEYYQGQQDKLHKDVLELDDKLQLIFELRQEVPLRLFPYSSKEGLKWYSPADKLPPGMEESRQQYIHAIMPLLRDAAKAGHDNVVAEGIGKMQGYQKRYGGTSLPSQVRTWAERTYNGVPFTTLLFMLNLGMAIVSLFAGRLSRIVLVVSALLQTLVLALRWIISGNAPMSNGYETMLLMAWIATWLAIAMARRARIMVTFGFLTSGFFLLVSHLGQLNPQISHLMPVLNSPLLSIHVSIIMLAYTLLCMTFACGVTALLRPQKAEYLQRLSLIFLYPSLSALGIGIFTGAIWANISWGTYWSWDPKEVWALITLMVYAAAAHRHTLSSLQRAHTYHLYVVACLSHLTDDLLRRQLFPWRDALLCLNILATHQRHHEERHLQGHRHPKEKPSPVVEQLVVGDIVLRLHFAYPKTDIAITARLSPLSSRSPHGGCSSIWLTLEHRTGVKRIDTIVKPICGCVVLSGLVEAEHHQHDDGEKDDDISENGVIKQSHRRGIKMAVHRNGHHGLFCKNISLQIIWRMPPNESRG